MTDSPNNPSVNPSDGIPERWRPLCDENGDVITLTEDQVRAVWHAVHAVELVREREGHPSLHEGSFAINASKSRLLGRLLLEGKPPHWKCPPRRAGGPAWWLVEGEPSDG